MFWPEHLKVVGIRWFSKLTKDQSLGEAEPNEVSRRENLFSDVIGHEGNTQEAKGDA